MHAGRVAAVRVGGHHITTPQISLNENFG